MKYFYIEIIETESIFSSLEDLNLEEGHKKELAGLIDSLVHQTVLDTVLSKLMEEDRNLFLSKFREDPEDLKLLEFLNSRIDNLEQEINQAIEDLIEELIKDIEEAKGIGND